MSTKYWMDGISCTQGAVSITPDSPLCSWGEGFFETIRVQNGKAMHLSKHRDRMKRSLESHYYHSWNPHVFNRVWDTAERCGDELDHGKLRIVSSPADAEANELRYISQLAPWTPPSAESYERGVDLIYATVPHPGLGQLGKSNSYHWARLGHYEAKKHGVDEVVFATGGELIETSYASLLLKIDDDWITPRPEAGGLASTTLAALRELGVNIKARELPIGSEDEAEAMVLVSALRLVLGVRRFEDRHFKNPDAAAKPLRELLLRGDRK
jgi:branched-subunit amino acid aminotransferase/4-amino-4-deoxychorismate lyase